LENFVPHSRKETPAMIEFRWVVFLTLWTLLIGPILNFGQRAPTAQHPRAKTEMVKTQSGR